MTIDPELLSLIRWAMTGIGAVASAVVGLAVKGLSAILGMQRDTTKALTEQAATNKAISDALHGLPCVRARDTHFHQSQPIPFTKTGD